MKDGFYIPSLDGIRALSVALVFGSHVGFAHIIPGGFGVTVFFFLSGYLITTLLAREYDRYGSISQPAFYLRRLFRLAPPILITLLLSYGLLWLGLAQGGIDIYTILSQIFSYYNYYSLHFGPAPTVEGLGVLWSLAVEEHFYLIWPTLFILLCHRMHRNGAMGARVNWYILGLLIAILIWRCTRYYLLGASGWRVYISSDTRLDSMLYGCLLAMMQWNGTAQRLFPQDRPARFRVLALSLLALLMCFAYRDEAFRYTVRFDIQGLALLPLFHYAVTRPDDIGCRLLNWRPIRRIGQWSFSIYLFHEVLIKALIYNKTGEPGSWQVVGLSAALSLAYGAAVFKWIEKPLYPLRKQIVRH